MGGGAGNNLQRWWWEYCEKGYVGGKVEDVVPLRLRDHRARLPPAGLVTRNRELGIFNCERSASDVSSGVAL